MLDQKTKKTLSGFQSNALADIDRQGHQLANLVNKLLSFTLVEGNVLELNRTVVNLKGICKEIYGHFHEAVFQKGVKLEIDDSCNAINSLYVDEEKIKEVFFNLIDNAIKFNDKNEKTVRISDRKISGEMIEFSITDNGPGIPPEEHDKIFQMFYQIEENFTGQTEGAGLGLPLVKRIIEAHGGMIRIESGLHDGSRFIFTLPAQKILEN
jgi:signal transduction histidine kinase